MRILAFLAFGIVLQCGCSKSPEGITGVYKVTYVPIDGPAEVNYVLDVRRDGSAGYRGEIRLASGGSPSYYMSGKWKVKGSRLIFERDNHTEGDAPKHMEFAIESNGDLVRVVPEGEHVYRFSKTRSWFSLFSTWFFTP